MIRIATFFNQAPSISTSSWFWFCGVGEEWECLERCGGDGDADGDADGEAEDFLKERIVFKNGECEGDGAASGRGDESWTKCTFWGLALRGGERGWDLDVCAAGFDPNGAGASGAEREREFWAERGFSAEFTGNICGWEWGGRMWNEESDEEDE